MSFLEDAIKRKSLKEQEEKSVCSSEVTDYSALRAIVKELTEMVASDSLTWEEKYDEVFGGEIGNRIQEVLSSLEIRMNYYDPDSGYDDDVRAYCSALETLVENINS